MDKESHKPSIFANGLWAMYGIAFLAGMSLAVFIPLISLFLEERGISTFWIGAIATIYYLAIAISSPLVGRKLKRTGVRRILLSGLILAGVITPFFVMVEGLVLWFGIRIFMAIGVSFFLVGGQTALNSLNQEENKAITNGVYSLCMAIGFGLGPVIGNPVYSISPQLAFTMGGILTLSGTILIWKGLPHEIRTVEEALPQTQTPVWRKIVTPVHTIFAFGFLEATLFSMFQLFLIRQGYDSARAGYAFSILMVGTLLSIVPVTYLADRLGKLKILFVCLSLGMLASVGLVFSGTYNLIKICALLGGIGFGPIFPISLSIVGETLSTDELPSGSALFNSLFSFGAAAGPILTAMLMERFGNQHLFTLTTILFMTVIFHIILKAFYRD